MNKYCQGPKCHTYQTQDRKRGPKGSKYFQTRTISRYGYGDNHFCTQICWSDWWVKHGTQAVDHFGRLREPIRLTQENAWVKDYDFEWQSGTTHNWRWVNTLTNQRILISQEEYDNPNLIRPNTNQTNNLSQ